FYTVTDQDAAGPFVKIPADMMERATLAKLDYENIEEALAERFHSSPKLLRGLNPGVAYQAGDQILVPDVATSKPQGKAAALVLGRETHGCIHVTNWDALRLAAMAAPGVPVDVRG